MGKDPKKKPALHEHALRFVLALAEKVWAGHARQPTGCVRLYTRSWYVPGAHAAQVPRVFGLGGGAGTAYPREQKQSACSPDAASDTSNAPHGAHACWFAPTL